MCLRVHLDYLVQSGHAQRLFQVFKRAFRLRILLDQQVVQNVLVPLDQPLRVLLPVLQLFVAVPLDPFQQRCQRELLLVAQLGLLLLDDRLHLRQFGS